MDELGWSDRHTAYLALRATLHALRDHLTVEEVARLGSECGRSAAELAACWAPPGEAFLLQTGAAYGRATDRHQQRPPMQKIFR